MERIDFERDGRGFIEEARKTGAMSAAPRRAESQGSRCFNATAFDWPFVGRDGILRADWESTHSYFREDAAAGLIALSIWRKGFQSGGLGTDSLHHCAPPRSQESLNSAWVRPASS